MSASPHPARDRAPTARLVIVDTPPLAPEDIPPLEAGHFDTFVLDGAELDAETCPPDRRYVLSSTCEAWVYDHGAVADLVFVRVE